MKSKIEFTKADECSYDGINADRYSADDITTSSQTIAKPNVICCGVLELMQLSWMKLEDGRKCMPYIDGHSDENMYRINNCPSCGKYVRDVIVEP